MVYQRPQYISPPQFGQMQPPQQQMPPPGTTPVMPPPQYGNNQYGRINPAGDPEYTKGPNDMPHPGEITMTTKDYYSKKSRDVVLAFIIGMALMWKIYPIFQRTIEAIFGG